MSDRKAHLYILQQIRPNHLALSHIVPTDQILTFMHVQCLVRHHPNTLLIVVVVVSELYQ